MNVLFLDSADGGTTSPLTLSFWGKELEKHNSTFGKRHGDSDTAVTCVFNICQEQAILI